MNTQPQQKISVQTLTQLAILVAIEVVMKLIGLGSVPVGPLYMSFLTVPIAIGAIVIGAAGEHAAWRRFRLCELHGRDQGRVDYDLDAAGCVGHPHVHPVFWSRAC